jgi:hypothetical protein
MRRPRVRLATTVLVLIAGGGAVYLVSRSDAAVRNAYAAWWVADMVIEYLETHGGAWPRGWDDLQEPYEECVRRSGRPWSFEDLRGRVEVDWGADPARLAVASGDATGPPFRVIWLRGGGQAHWEGHEPNRMVLDYLRGRTPGR